MVFKESFKSVSRKIKGVIQGYLKIVKREFEGSFKDVLRKLTRKF